MAEGQLDHFADLGHLLAAAANVIVADLGEASLFVFALDGLALGVNDGVLGDDAVLGWVGLDHLEFDRAGGALGKEGVALADGAVGLEEVGLEEDLEQVAGQACAAAVREDLRRNGHLPSTESSKGRT
jgi:hypothetical protein